MSANLENSALATGLEKVSFHSNSKEKGNAKECSNYHTIDIFTHTVQNCTHFKQGNAQNPSS